MRRPKKYQYKAGWVVFVNKRPFNINSDGNYVLDLALCLRTTIPNFEMMGFFRRPKIAALFFNTVKLTMNLFGKIFGS